MQALKTPSAGSLTRPLRGKVPAGRKGDSVVVGSGLRLAFFCSFSLSKKNSASGRTCAKTRPLKAVG